MRKTVIAKVIHRTLNVKPFSYYPTTAHVELDTSGWITDIDASYIHNEALDSLRRTDNAFIPYANGLDHVRSKLVSSDTYRLERRVPDDAKMAKYPLHVTDLQSCCAMPIEEPSDGEIYQRVGRGFNDNGLSRSISEAMDALPVMSLEDLVPTELPFGTAVKREAGLKRGEYALDHILRKEVGLDKIQFDPMPIQDISVAQSVELALISTAIEETIDRNFRFTTPYGNNPVSVGETMLRALFAPTPEMIAAAEKVNTAFSVRSLGNRVPDDILDSTFHVSREQIEEMRVAGEATTEKMRQELSPWIVELPLTNTKFDGDAIRDIDVSEVYPTYRGGEKDED